MNVESFIRLPLIKGTAAALFFSLILSSSPGYAQAPECSGIQQMHLLRNEPVLINPGARCDIATLLLGLYEFQGFDSYYLPTVSNFCVYVRRAGRKETIGPICNQKKGAIGLPVDLEYLWSGDGQLIRATVTLVPKRRR